MFVLKESVVNILLFRDMHYSASSWALASFKIDIEGFFGSNFMNEYYTLNTVNIEMSTYEKDVMIIKYIHTYIA